MDEIKRVVGEILLENPSTRSNDNYLIYLVYQRMGWPTDLKDIAKSGLNHFESIRRCRQKIQMTNPHLKAEEKVTRKRNERIEQFKELAKGI